MTTPETMVVTLSRTLNPARYESVKQEVSVSKQDYPQAAELYGDDLRRYLQYQAYRIIGSFELIEGVPAETVHNKMTAIRNFLRIPEIEAKLPSGGPEPAPPPPVRQTTPTAPPEANPVTRPGDQYVETAGNNVPVFNPSLLDASADAAPF